MYMSVLEDRGKEMKDEGKTERGRLSHRWTLLKEKKTIDNLQTQTVSEGDRGRERVKYGGSRKKQLDR